MFRLNRIRWSHWQKKSESFFPIHWTKQQKRNEWNERLNSLPREDAISHDSHRKFSTQRQLFRSPNSSSPIWLCRKKFKYFADIIYPLLRFISVRSLSPRCFVKLLINGRVKREEKLTTNWIGEANESSGAIALFNDETTFYRSKENWIMKNFHPSSLDGGWWWRERFIECDCSQ